MNLVERLFNAAGLWVGGVGMATTVLLPALRRLSGSGQAARPRPHSSSPTIIAQQNDRIFTIEFQFMPN